MNRRRLRRVSPWVLALGTWAVVLAAAPAADAQPIAAEQMAEAAVQGFGDRDNSQPWAMAWWRGKLYVGTGRSTYCLQSATLAYFYQDSADSLYPPQDAEVACTPDPHDLPLQAEIWRWTPETNQWEMLYRSPADVPIQGTSPVKYTARDVGYRGMLVFREADGTEALYVSGVTSRAAQGVGAMGPVPPPRILRSTDGETFQPVPQDPGTFLGDLYVTGFRSMVSYQGRLFVVASVGLLGHGLLLEAAHPEQGNNAFRKVNPMRADDPTKELTFYEIAVFNGHLYAGTGVQPTIDDTKFMVMKTQATGTPPYTFTTVIPEGAYRTTQASPAVISMAKHRRRLYIGTDRELLRINPDDSWDLVVGLPRPAPNGRMLQPLSGFGSGFDNILNIHMWRMGRYRGWLYVGTQDQSAKWRETPIVGARLQDQLGADIYATDDGWRYTMVTRTGLGDSFNNGLRNLVSTPHGLFMGTANHTFGARIYRSLPASTPAPPLAPQRLEVERTPDAAMLTWEGSPNAVRFHILRDSGFALPQEIAVVDAQGPAGRLFIDRSLTDNAPHRYAVVAEDPTGQRSGPSNTVRIPVVAPVPTFVSMEELLLRWRASPHLAEKLTEARAAVGRGDYAAARAQLEYLRLMARRTLGRRWRSQDFEVVLDKFLRRVALAEAGKMDPARLSWLP
jgi:hypothetical protein